MQIELRVRYSEVDRMGFVHHKNYFDWLETARLDMMRDKGISYTDWEDAGFFLPLVEARCQYLAPIHFDDVIIIQLEKPSEERMRLIFQYKIYRKADMACLATASTTHVVLDGKGRPIRWPAQVRCLMELS